MNLGIIGLGKMGNAIAFRALDGGFTVYGFDKNKQARDDAKEIGVDTKHAIKDIARESDLIWLMVPIQFVDDVLEELVPHLKAGDIIVDGGNSFYKDSIRRAKSLQKKGIIFLDCGTSGGIEGRGRGFCLMFGGDHDAYTKIHTVLAAIAAPGGVGHFGPSGVGHYVKMIHNGIEYGLLQAYAEGFQIVKEGTFADISIDLEELSRVWQNGSVIRSFLLSLTHTIFEESQELHDISGEIAEGGTGKWTVEEAHEHDIPVPIIDKALEVRKWSRETGGNYATKLIAMLRNKFGGHAVKKIKGD